MFINGLGHEDVKNMCRKHLGWHYHVDSWFRRTGRVKLLGDGEIELENIDPSGKNLL